MELNKEKTVPYYGLGGLSSVREQLHGLGTDIKTHHIRRYLIRINLHYLNRSVNDETKNGEGFSKELAELVDGEVFVMDAFGSSHRAHASTVGVTKFVKETAVGYLMNKEIEYRGTLWQR